MTQCGVPNVAMVLDTFVLGCYFLCVFPNGKTDLQRRQLQSRMNKCLPLQEVETGNVQLLFLLTVNKCNFYDLLLYKAPLENCHLGCQYPASVNHLVFPECECYSPSSELLEGPSGWWC